MKKLIFILLGFIIGVVTVYSTADTSAMPIGHFYGTNGSSCSSLKGVEKHTCYTAAASFEVLDKLDNIESRLSSIEMQISIK